MSQNGSESINSVRQAWVAVTSTKEALSRRSAQTWRSPPPPTNGNSIRSCQRKWRSALAMATHRLTPGWPTKALPGADRILLLNIWTVRVSLVRLCSNCWDQQSPVWAVLRASALRWTEGFFSRWTRCVLCVGLWCVLCPCQQLLDCLKRTTCRNGTVRQQRVVSHDWTLKDVIKVFWISVLKVCPGLRRCHEASGPAHLPLCEGHQYEGVLLKAHLSSAWSHWADPRCLHASVDDEAGLAQVYSVWTFGASRLHVSHQLPHAMTRQHLSTTKTRSSCFHIWSLKVQQHASKEEWVIAAAMTLIVQDLCFKDATVWQLLWIGSVWMRVFRTILGSCEDLNCHNLRWDVLPHKLTVYYH